MTEGPGIIDISARITFGMIVLNGEPFTRYNLRAIYPFAHQIIVVEGACPTAKGFATEDGHSSDGTMEVLRRFQLEDDPKQKLVIVTAEDHGHTNGFWSEKDEMSQAYARRAMGDYLWQIDVDEFYHEKDMLAVIQILEGDPSIKAVTFRTLPFYGGLGYLTDGILLRKGARDFNRVFAWAPRYWYTTHRPPTVVDDKGCDLHEYRVLTAEILACRGIYLYHYCFLFPFQIRFKFGYYDGLDKLNRLDSILMKRREDWKRNYFDLRKPFLIDDTSVFGQPSWLVRFNGQHPKAIRELWNDLEQGRITIECRCTDDIEKLLSKPIYIAVIRLLPLIQKPIDFGKRIYSILCRIASRMIGAFCKSKEAL